MSELRLPALALLTTLVAGCASQPPQSPAPMVAPPPATTPVPIVTPTPVPPIVEVLPTPTPAPVPIPTPKPGLTEAQGRALLNQLLPPKISDRKGWTDDILDAFTALKIPYTPEYFCAANAVIEQESSWQSDPTVPGLPKIVWEKIGEKAAGYHVPLLVVQTALLKPSPNGQSYKYRIDHVKSERDMNGIFEDMQRDAAHLGLPFNMPNPIRTVGPMQVSVEFAEAHVRAWPYPYKMATSVRDTAFTRRGGLYFGIAILLQYPAPYTDMIYRFADFNAGRYSSRNVAFQLALEKVSGQKIDLDGDLLVYTNGVPNSKPSDVEQALFSIAGKLGLSHEAIRRDLLTEKTAAFAQTPLYTKLFELAEAHGQKLPRAAMPQIRLVSPKITRKLTTEWFAKRVDGRYQTCLGRVR
ncbi:DUF1615 domain-containing protein [Andreprevotia chitinilytica]|uniref:DUF1615 domain-containing protein n=1 Tax=Andreprevotia chitinilytica TaxID=396808 RepID=UPI000A55715B|nr:DUF1615 domain-containing protein [Andreprevotia chitinilytica]